MPKHEIDFGNPKVLNEILSKMVADTPVAYIIHDRNRRVHYVNDFFLKLRKLQREEILGNFCYNMANSGKPCELCVVHDAIAAGERRRLKRRDVLPDGSVCLIDNYAIPLKDASGHFDYILEVVVDRTRERTIQESNNMIFLNMVETLISMLDKKDPYTSTHSRDVMRIAVKLGLRLGLPEPEIYDLRLAALLHDIGKIYIPDRIINKPSRLNGEEYDHIRKHATETLNMLANLSQFSLIREAAGHHHERWDGKGYPHGHAGKDIPLGARILAIADTYDAITSNRSYRKALAHHVAMQEIERCAGTQFDPRLVAEFIAMVESSHPDRESMLRRDGRGSVRRKRNPNSHKIERTLTPLSHAATRIIDRDEILCLMSEDMFARAIMENTPCYYTIIDEDFNILFASDNVVAGTGLTHEQLRSMRCFEISGNKTDCFDIVGGEVRCPAARTFASGKPQDGKAVNNYGGGTTYCDVYAIPLTLEDKNGKLFTCVMEILLDRTQEMAARLALETDIKSLLDTLFQLVANMDPATTNSSDAIIHECTTFSEYLTTMHQKTRHLPFPTPNEEERVR